MGFCWKRNFAVASHCTISFKYSQWVTHVVTCDCGCKQRVSARDCRARKKEYVQDLEHKAQYLESENLEQQTRLKQMSDRIAELEAHIRRQQTNQAIWAAANMTLGIDTSSEEGIGHGGT